MLLPTTDSDLLCHARQHLSANAFLLFTLVYNLTAGKARQSAAISYEDIHNLTPLKSKERISKTIRELTASGLATYNAPFKNQTRRQTGRFTLCKNKPKTRKSTLRNARKTEQNNTIITDNKCALSLAGYPDYSIPDGKVINGVKFMRGRPVFTQIYPSYPHDLEISRKA